ncbi:MAG: DnaA ATPase domain-containing protein [bacterium]
MIKKTVDFENFYVYEGNKVAFMAAQKIVEFPGEIFNPLYVYGTGSYGKTYFLWALYGEFSKKEPALFFTPKEFENYLENTNQFDTAIFVDDINRIGEKYQDAMLGIVDILISKNKQMCFSGNVPPRELKNLTSKLISRLEGGLVCDLQAPREMALVDFIKKKSEERGIIIPDEIALELTQLSAGSFRAIDGMLNRLVIYASLGNITFDLNTVRLILKEFYPRGIYSPVASLLEELKKSADAILPEISEKKDPYSEYREKIYIWEMKGFDTSELKPLLNNNIETLANAYNIFIKKVEKLIELQKEFGALDTSKFPEEAMKIETMLFSPNKIEEIEKLLATIKEKIKVEEKKPFENYLIGECNKTVIELYEKSILPNLGKKFNPYVVFGPAGTGKTFLCQEISRDLQIRGYKPLILDFEQQINDLLQCLDGKDALLIDNFHKIIKIDENLRKKYIEIIIDYIKQEHPVFIFSEPFSEDVTFTENEKLIFEFGVEATLNEPDAEITKILLRSKITPEEFERILIKGLPQFKNFYELEDYIKNLEKRAAAPEAPSTEEIISLGLPGEESIVPLQEIIETEELEPQQLKITEAMEPAKPPESPPLMVEEPLKKIKEHRLFVPEIIDELLEENYEPLTKKG